MQQCKVIAATVMTIMLTGCGIKEYRPAAEIEGFWISTGESSSLFAPYAHNVALAISSDSTRQVTARAFFMRNGRYKMDWKFVHADYDSALNQVVLLDSDSDTLICRLDVESDRLRGVFHSEDKVVDHLDFERPDRDFAPLFYPRIPDRNGRIHYQYHKPESVDDGLEAASIFEFVDDSEAVDRLMNKILHREFGRLESLLIIKDGRLVLEEYFYGYHREKLHRINSCTKSVTSLLLGITLDRHHITDVNRPVFNFFPKYESLKTPEKAGITLQHVMTMTAGFVDEEESDGLGLDNYIQYILESPMASEPGTKFKYSGKCSNLLGGIIHTLENRQADEFGRDVLFSKLGISDFSWERENDVLPCDAGLDMRPRDMAKIGLMVLNDGQWKGEQVVPRAWIAASTQPRVAESPFFDYGYQWWCRSKSNRCWWDEPFHGGKNEHDMFLALGAGGQYIMVVRDLNMVVVTTASDFNHDGMDHIKVPMVIEDIVPMFEQE